MKSRVCGALPFLILLAACAGQDPVAPPIVPPTGQVASVSVTPGMSELVITPGAPTPSVQLLATLSDVTGTVVLGQLITWSSDNAIIVSVDTTGLVTAAGTGTTTVTATSGGTRGYAVITVGPPAAVAGTWSFAMRGGRGTGGSCSSQGSLVISQATSAPAFTATMRQSGSCGGGGAIGSWLASFPALLNFSGSVAVESIRFTADLCSYHGAVFNTPADSMSGMFACSRRRGYNMPSFYIVGTWSAVRTGG